ncbi:MAG TPA: hypothetical protein DCM87_16655 [Planctomycetes bacterium]|nr:hypothetical protein [Planctomycetota bacterium]
MIRAVGCAALPLALLAQSQVPTDVTLRMTPKLTRMSLTVQLVTTTTLVQGWSFGICHAPENAAIMDAEPADELDFLVGGQPVGFLAYHITEQGVTQGVVAGSVDPERPMPPIDVGPYPTGLPLMHVRYEVRAQTPVSFCDTLGSPPVSSIVVSDGTSLKPAKESALLLMPDYAQDLSFTITPSLSDGIVTVRMFSPTAAVEGWSFAVCHWEDKASIAEFAPAADLDVLRGGDPVDFLNIALVPGDLRAGVTQAAIIDFGAKAYGPYPQGIDLLHIRYRVAAETAIAFCDKVLGNPPIANVIVIRGDSYAPPPSQLAGATLVPGALAAHFIRGDANRDNKVNIADAVALCWTAVGRGPIPCEDAGDVNDNGRIDIADPIYLLMYLFAAGRPPASPFPQAGADLTPWDDLGCAR